MHPHHATMIADGCPAALLMTKKARAEAWAKMPPRAGRAFIPSPTGVDAATAKALRAAETEERNALRLRQDMIKTSAKKAKTPKETTMAKKPKRNPKLPATHPANRGPDPKVISRLKAKPGKPAAPLKKPVPARKPRKAAPVDGARAGIIEALGGMNAKPVDPTNMGKRVIQTQKKVERAAKKITKVKGEIKQVRAESKLAIVVGLLTRKEGCTTADILKATEWPSVSVPQQARAAGLTLRQEKDGKVTRYWGTKTA